MTRTLTLVPDHTSGVQVMVADFGETRNVDDKLLGGFCFDINDRGQIPQVAQLCLRITGDHGLLSHMMLETRHAIVVLLFKQHIQYVAQRHGLEYDALYETILVHEKVHAHFQLQNMHHTAVNLAIHTLHTPQVQKLMDFHNTQRPFVTGPAMLIEEFVAYAVEGSVGVGFLDIDPWTRFEPMCRAVPALRGFGELVRNGRPTRADVEQALDIAWQCLS